MSLIPFDNAVATIKPNSSVDMDKLRSQRLFAKLYLKPGTKFDQVTSLQDFMLSQAGNHIVAEPFILGKANQIISSDKLFLSVDITAKFHKDSRNRMYWVELIHPTIDLSASEEVNFIQS